MDPYRPTTSARRDARDRCVRPAAFAGRVYESSPAALRSQLERYFDHPRGSGRPDSAPRGPTGRKIRGVISPHIDFQRGGPVYTWAFRELAERTDAEVFVVFGVAHTPCARRFALTRCDFDTPLGVVPTDVEFVERLNAISGSNLFADEPAHRYEHSIEFQVVFLKYLLETRGPFEIVPVLVGSFHDLMLAGIDPIEDPEVRRFIDALRETIARSGRRVAYVGGIDLSHVGPDFGDPVPVDGPTADAVAAFDHQMLAHALAGDPRRWFEAAGKVGNRWRVCGLAATYTLLHAIGPTRGRLLRYGQSIDDRRRCMVTYCSAALEAESA